MFVFIRLSIKVAFGLRVAVGDPPRVVLSEKTDLMKLIWEPLLLRPSNNCMLGSGLFARWRFFEQYQMRIRAKIARKPATEPTATPATAPLLSPESLSLLLVDEVSAAAVAPDPPTVTVWTWPPIVSTLLPPEVVVLAPVVSVEVSVCEKSACLNPRQHSARYKITHRSSSRRGA